MYLDMIWFIINPFMFDFVIECIINFLNNTIALAFKKINL